MDIRFLLEVHTKKNRLLPPTREREREKKELGKRGEGCLKRGICSFLWFFFFLIFFFWREGGGVLISFFFLVSHETFSINNHNNNHNNNNNNNNNNKQKKEKEKKKKMATPPGKKEDIHYGITKHRLMEHGLDFLKERMELQDGEGS